MTTAAFLTAKAEGELPGFLRALGYEVDWDYDRRGRWWEAYDGGRMVFQIDDWTPLQAFLRDLPGLVELERHATEAERGKAEWEMRCKNLEDAQELLRRVRVHQRSKS